MIVNSLYLKNYKNILNMSLSFDEKVNVIYGENAQGKTNILEALWLFTGTRSFRSVKDADQIMFGKNSGEIEVNFSAYGREQSQKIIFGEKKESFINDIKQNSVSSFAGNYYAVIFSPEHLSLVKGGPAERRSFIDNALCQIKPKFGEYLSKYKKNLIQRNALLKDYRFNSSIEPLLEIFEENLAQIGTQIIIQRLKYLEVLKKEAKEIYFGISSKKEEIDIRYIPSFKFENEEDIKENFRTALKKSRDEDALSLSTSAGPHRDDIEVEINGISARKFGSQGQQRSCVLALKLAEASVLKNKTGEMPIALLDDVMSELDESRQDYILQKIEDWQVFITCCDPNTILRLKQGKTFHIKSGEVI